MQIGDSFLQKFYEPPRLKEMNEKLPKIRDEMKVLKPELTFQPAPTQLVPIVNLYKSPKPTPRIGGEFSSIDEVPDHFDDVPTARKADHFTEYAQRQIEFQKSRNSKVNLTMLGKTHFPSLTQYQLTKEVNENQTFKLKDYINRLTENDEKSKGLVMIVDEKAKKMKA